MRWRVHMQKYKLKKKQQSEVLIAVSTEKNCSDATVATVSTFVKNFAKIREWMRKATKIQ